MHPLERFFRSKKAFSITWVSLFASLTLALTLAVVLTGREPAGPDSAAVSVSVSESSEPDQGKRRPVSGDPDRLSPKYEANSTGEASSEESEEPVSSSEPEEISSSLSEKTPEEEPVPEKKPETDPIPEAPSSSAVSVPEKMPVSLSVTSPEEAVFSTDRPSVTFRGAGDPDTALTLDGSPVEMDENGFFSVSRELEPGENRFTLMQGDTVRSFTVTRTVQIIREVSPAESVSLDGGMRLEISALAYAGADVTAVLGDVSIPLQETGVLDDDTDTGSVYARFSGSYTVPSGTGNGLPLGRVHVTAAWEGITDTVQGASVSVNPSVAAGNGNLVVVTADSAKTFPTNVLNNESNPAYFPLPKGTKDYIVGDVLTFRNASGTYQYYKLQSGLRVYVEDVTPAEGELALGNVISSMDISSDRQYTYVRLAMRDPVPHRVTYTSGGISFDFQYTSGVPGSQEVSGSPLIRSADWSGTVLTLRFLEQGKFFGYYGYYEGDALVLRLTNPPASLSGVRIAIDPGHGGKDKGAPGYSGMCEAEINAAIAAKTAAVLREAGASVKLIDTSSYLTLSQRLDEARAYDANLYLSIHANSSEVNPASTGTEVYYFYPSGQRLASLVAERVSAALDTANRGAKAAQYVVTSDPRFTSILIETGFVSSKTEYAKLTDPSRQSDIAKAIANGVASFVSGTNTVVSGGNSPAEAETPETPKTPEEETEAVSIRLAKEDITLWLGESYQCQAETDPQGIELRWTMEDESVASVNSSGRVTAVSPGTTRLTVSSGDVKAVCIVRIKE